MLYQTEPRPDRTREEALMPENINLGNYEHDDYYKQATLKVTGKKQGSEMLLTAKSITYGITITKNAPNPDEAIRFVQYLLDPEKGLKVLNDMGQPPFFPTRVNSEKVINILPVPFSRAYYTENTSRGY